LRVVFNNSDCYVYDKGFAVPFILANLVTGESADLRGAIDTGFDGDLMVDSETYERLNLRLSERPESEFPAYRTFSGTILFKSSLARVTMPGRNSMAEVITPVSGLGKILVGRRALKNLTTLLHKAERYCVGDAKIE